jgi:hypothetical protein
VCSSHRTAHNMEASKEAAAGACSEPVPEEVAEDESVAGSSSAEPAASNKRKRQPLMVTVLREWTIAGVKVMCKLVRASIAFAVFMRVAPHETLIDTFVMLSCCVTTYCSLHRSA